jgi:hypothetical protein
MIQVVVFGLLYHKQPGHLSSIPDYLYLYTCTVKPVLKGHPLGQKKIGLI